MHLLLDTQVALWALTDDMRLTEQGRRLILEPNNILFVSIASVWEIAIKHALGRGSMPISAERAAKLFQGAGFIELPIISAHTVAVESLSPIHGDPFDRMLVAQALTEPLRLMTHDRTVARYGDTILLV